MSRVCLFVVGHNLKHNNATATTHGLMDKIQFGCDALQKEEEEETELFSYSKFKNLKFVKNKLVDTYIQFA